MRRRARRPSVGRVRTFLVEHYWPGVTADAFGTASARVRTRVEELAREGRRVRYLHSTLVPEDEAGYCVLEAESSALVEEAYASAGVGYERVVESIAVEGCSRWGVEMFNPYTPPTALGGQTAEEPR